MMLDILAYSIPVVIFVVTLRFAIWTYGKNGKLISACLQTILLTALLSGVTAYWWFQIAGPIDGLSAYLGMYLYLIVGAVIAVVGCLVLVFRRRKVM